MVGEERRGHHAILMVPGSHLLLDMGGWHHVASAAVGAVQAVGRGWKHLQVPLLLLVARLTLVLRILFSMRRSTAASDAPEYTRLQVQHHGCVSPLLHRLVDML